MKWTPYHAAIATLAYDHLFEYPLMDFELSEWLIGGGALSQGTLLKVKKQFFSHRKYFELDRNNSFVATRIIREKESQKKWHLLRIILPFLSFIPTIELIGVSGGLAKNNAKIEDDIDLFFIVRPGTIWISRFLVLCTLELFGRRRKFGQKEEKNRFCPNMFLVSSHLSLLASDRNLYSAHEVLQVVPVFVRHNMYEHFLEANSWVKTYLPNAWATKKIGDKKQWTRRELAPGILQRIFFLCLEIPAKFFQQWYMRSHRTQEIISDTVLRFHPRDIRIYVKEKYFTLLKKYKVPLDSPFLYSLQ